MTTFCVAVDARTSLEPEPRGEGRSVERLYREIASANPDWRLRLIGETPARAQALTWPNSTVTAFRVPGHRYNAWENVGLPMAAWKAGANVLHCTSSSAPRWSPVPFVVTVHDIIPLVFDDGWPKSAVERFRTSLASAVRRAAKIIAVSKHTRDDLVRVLSVPRERIEVVYWGADRADAGKPIRGVNAPRPAWASAPYLLHLGGEARRKNTQEIIRGFAEIANADRDVTLVVTGLGAAFRERLIQLAGDLGVAHRVRLLGYVDDGELDNLLTHAEALLYLSLYEGFGLPLLEALARGVPVVAARRTSIPEVVGEAALLVEPTDRKEWVSATLQLLREAPLRSAIADAGRRRTARFSWSFAAESTSRILTQASQSLPAVAGAG